VKQTWPHLLTAFLLMGGWAVFANRGHEMPAPLVAGLVQGCLSALITLGLKRLIEGLVPRLGALVTVGVAWAISFSLLFSLHTLAGTPEVLWTLAVPNLVATLYAALYATALKRVT
jgi:hypothetical protein